MTETGLIGHWPLQRDGEDHSGRGRHGRVRDIRFEEDGPPGVAGSGRFNGESSWLEVDSAVLPAPNRESFTISLWMRGDADVIGDLVSRFDGRTRRGFHLTGMTATGMTTTATPNYRHLQFGIDDGRFGPGWQDCGRPGNAVKIAALAVSDGVLYAGTCERGADERGRLWRYAGGQQWIDLGNPVGCNALTSIVEYEGALLVGVGRYLFVGSALGETLNRTPGGPVYRVSPNGEWSYCGHPGAEGATPEEAEAAGYETGKADDTIALTVYQGRLYAVSNHRRNVFRYEGGTEWSNVGLDARVITLAIYHDRLYALGNGGPVYRYEGGAEWTECGCPRDSRQTYSGVTAEGRFLVGTWPTGSVQEYAGGTEWRHTPGVAFYEKEIMGMLNYNGKVYLGTLPMANVCRIDDASFTFVGNLDNSPVVLRRVWGMATWRGALYAGTLPSGRVWRAEAGRMASADRALPHGWHRVAAVKGERDLRLYVDGQLAAVSEPYHADDYNLAPEAPLRIGFGPFDYFRGNLCDVRLYDRALSAEELRG